MTGNKNKNRLRKGNNAFDKINMNTFVPLT